MRGALNFESGLNDGLAVPFLLLFIVLASGTGAHDPGALLTELILEEVGIGVLIGCSVTAVGTALLQRAKAADWISGTWRAAPVVMLALTCFTLAQNLGGSGYIAAFVGGLMFGRLTGDEAHGLVHDSEQVGEVLAMLAWVVFGAAVIAVAAPAFELRHMAYAAAALFVVRRLAILEALSGYGERMREKLVLGWFGPRGLASIAFAVIALNAEVERGRELAMIVVTTIFLSAFLRGLSANPLPRRIGVRRRTP
ncbi:MAG: cation:proton antiporter [Pseudomonadota bacterium]|nr:cation:proton antiporter [Pseudomonadota bacterium]